MWIVSERGVNVDRESAVVREGLMWIVSERGVNVDRESGRG